RGAKKAVWDCDTEKSPGPDGFTFDFYRRFWKIIGSDVFEAVKQFFTLGKFPKGCNSCFIALILKIPDANLVKDFRPISLIGSLYKIIAKILANRLVGVLGDIVDAVQSAFIADRQILDGPFILKVGGTMSRVQAWNDVIDKVQNRLSKWKLNALSIAGSKKESWVKWNNVMASKEKGGLRVASLYALNKDLMRKWIWRFYSQNSSLWARVIKVIHEEDGKVGKVDHSRSRSCWLNIVHEINELEKQGIKLLDHMKVKLGNGDKVIFWEDTWNGDKPFNDLYPRIYALESLKLAFV
nr:RNA-directed DNA polymerase, eukaryota, reverse transcriptase zinc-binding domain protein [Tanacetum cinerariifolium]